MVHTMPRCQTMYALLRAQPKIPAEEMRPTLLFFRGKCTPLKYSCKNNADNMGKLMRFHVRDSPGLLDVLAARASPAREAVAETGIIAAELGQM